MRTVIVGASLAGLRVAEGLRSSGYPGEVVLVGDERHLPYDRPPLSKQVLAGAWEPERTFFRNADELRTKGIDHRHSTTATGLEHGAAGGAVRCADGTTLHFDDLVIATGARPRQLPMPPLTGVLTLRTLEDVDRLTAAFAAAPRVTIIGGGFIGAEVASAARRRGLETTMVEALPAPLSRVLGARVGAACARLYERHGVTVHLDATVTGIDGPGHVEEVVLGDGTRIPADVVVVGIGAVPNTEWLDGSGLGVENGVLCDESGRAADHVWAVGDVARWYHPIFRSAIRVEHWTHATEQAHQVAQSIATGVPAALTAVPYVWSDQFGVKMQIAGRPSADADLVVASGDPDTARFVGLYVETGVVVGAVAFNQPRAIATVRRSIAERADVAATLGRLDGSR